MARTISDEELQLKRRARRRLIGAIVLVTAIVVVLPMVLDSEPKPSGEEVAIRIPSPNSGTFSPKLATEPPAPKPAPKGPPVQAKERQPAPAVTPAPEPAPQKPAKAEPAKPVAQASSGPASPKYVIQVIALADADKAKQLREKIAAAGVNSYTEVVKTVKGEVTRVRAGPFEDRKAAEKAQAQLKAIGLSGNITTK
jgi:DedD protein